MITRSGIIIRRLILTAFFTAGITIVTGYLPRLPIAGGAGGYVHLGDIFIYIAACILPFPYGMAAGGMGAGLADLLTGYAVWMPGTMIIKALMALTFSVGKKQRRIFTPRNMIMSVTAGVVCVGGYYLYEAIIVSSFVIPLASIVFNVIQAAISSVIFLIISIALDKINIIKIIERGTEYE